MKKYLVCILVCLVMIISCDGSGSGGGSSDDDSSNAPKITEFEFRLEPLSDVVPASFNVGDDIWMTFGFRDKDKDIESYVLTIKDATTLAVILPETEYPLGLEMDSEGDFLYTQADSSAPGTFRYEFYMKDKAGNRSETIIKNLTIN